MKHKDKSSKPVKTHNMVFKWGSNLELIRKNGTENSDEEENEEILEEDLVEARVCRKYYQVGKRDKKEYLLVDRELVKTSDGQYFDI